MLDEPAHVDERVLALAHVRKARHHLAGESDETLARLRRGCFCGRVLLHVPLPRTMTASSDLVRRAGEGSSNLTKYY